MSPTEDGQLRPEKKDKCNKEILADEKSINLAIECQRKSKNDRQYLGLNFVASGI